jgi:hypothetical protein
MTISGSAYPLSTITVLKDAQIAAQSISGPDGNFSITINDLTLGNYIFSVYAQDSNGNRSTLFTFPASFSTSATSEVSGVFLSPTISVNKQEVKQGDTIVIFGQSAPNAKVTINIHSSQTLQVQATSASSGAYLYDLDTTPLEFGSHSAISRTAKGNLLSDDSVSASFVVGDQNINAAPTATSSIKGDLNGDGHVNLVDFSILAYWYNKANPPVAYRLDGKTTIDFTDFSIMAYYWTG